MDKEKMINIDAALVDEPVFSIFEKDGEEVQVANFTLVKKYGDPSCVLLHFDGASRASAADPASLAESRYRQFSGDGIGCRKRA